ncbi:MAG: hypothetical protein ACXIVQ_07370 [Acidimicrobiales bacterium]
MKKAPPPPHVAIILDSAVRVVGASEALGRDLSQRGISFRRSGSVLEIAYPPSGAGGIPGNDRLVGILTELSQLGVGFAQDHTQMWSPADIVAELLDRGVSFAAPTAVGFDGHDWATSPLAPRPGTDPG